MKRIFTLLMAVSLVSVVTGQKLEHQYQFNNAIGPASDWEVSQSRALGQQELAKYEQRGGGSEFCEDFANGLAGNNPYGEWTIEDSGGNSIWMEATAASPAGEFSTNIDPLDSPTGDNGWMIFDCDFYNTPISNGFEDVTGYLISPVMDLTDMDAPIVDYFHYFRYCCFPGSPLTLEVTVDGGENWTVFEAHGSFIEAANTVSANPLNTKVDISCIAGNESEVQLRFGYNSAGATGYSHYFWGIDDVCVYNNEVVHDLEITQVTNGDIFNWWEYRITPYEQRIYEADGGLLAGTIFRNVGNSDETNCVITIDILDDGMNVIHTVSSDPFDVPSNANAPTCPHQPNDTLYIATGWEPDAEGMFYVRASITADEMDEDDTNNMMEKDIVYSADEYGHDDPDNLDLELFPRESDLSTNELTLYDPTGYGCWYHCPNEGSVAYGLTVTVGAGSDQGNEFEARLYRGIDDSPYDPNSAEVQTNSYWWLAGTYAGTTQFFPFDFENQLDPMHPYFVGVISEFESEYELTALAQSDSDTDNSTLRYEITGAGDFVWFTSQTETPDVRMILSEWVGVEELGEMNGIDLNQNMPNPATGNTIISYNLDQPTQVRFEIRDLQGRIMEVIAPGMMPAGQHQFDVNISDYAAGLYTYTLIANEDVRLTRRMTVR